MFLPCVHKKAKLKLIQLSSATAVAKLPNQRKKAGDGRRRRHCNVGRSTWGKFPHRRNVIVAKAGVFVAANVCHFLSPRITTVVNHFFGSRTFGGATVMNRLINVIVSPDCLDRSSFFALILSHACIHDTFSANRAVAANQRTRLNVQSVTKKKKAEVLRRRARIPTWTCM